MTASARRGRVPVRSARPSRAPSVRASAESPRHQADSCGRGLQESGRAYSPAAGSDATRQETPPRRRRCPAPASASPCPRQNHADEDEEIHQRAARVAGDDDDQSHHKGSMRCRLNRRFQSAKVSPILQQRKLIGDKTMKKIFTTSAGCTVTGNCARKPTPGFADVIHEPRHAVAISRLAEGREQQQEEKADVGQQPLPLLRPARICRCSRGKVERQPDEQAEAPARQRTQACRENCRTGDKHHAVERRGHAQRRQHRVGLAQHVMQRFPLVPSVLPPLPKILGMMYQYSTIPPVCKPRVFFLPLFTLCSCKRNCASRCGVLYYKF